jgi:hypothetical protein
MIQPIGSADSLTSMIENAIQEDLKRLSNEKVKELHSQILGLKLTIERLESIGVNKDFLLHFSIKLKIKEEELKKLESIIKQEKAL